MVAEGLLHAVHGLGVGVHDAGHAPVLRPRPARVAHLVARPRPRPALRRLGLGVALGLDLGHAPHWICNRDMVSLMLAKFLQL